MHNCRICRTSLSSLDVMLSKPLCDSCLNRFEFVHEYSGNLMCSNCKKLLASGEVKICQDCRYWDKTQPNIKVQNDSLIYYDEYAHEFLHKAKFSGDTILWEVMLYVLKRYAKLSKVPYQKVPSHHLRIIKRDFEHLHYLLVGMRRNQVQCLEKQSNVISQIEKGSFSERRKLITAFNLASTCPKKVILFDDVYTTGTTIRSCAAKLYEGGCQEVSSYTIFRAKLLYDS